MLKAEIKGIGIPHKGTPQGGILSPLLSNIVLNELDWWISNQWETKKTQRKYARVDVRNRALKKTDLKEIYIVRYADDFKIFCRDYKSAQKAFIAVKQWLKERLKLDINEGKSMVTNLRKNYSEFLGFKLKAIKGKNTKNGGYTAYSRMSDKARNKAIKTLKKKLKDINTARDSYPVMKYNSTVLGMHNYYKIATNVSTDFHDIAFIIKKCLYNRLRKYATDKGEPSKTYEKYYKKYKKGLGNGVVYLRGVLTYPVHGIATYNPLSFTQEVCNYTETGRRLIHRNLKTCDMRILKYLMNNPVQNQSVEFNDNRISLYAAQNGRCRVTKEVLAIGNMDTHHIKPRALGGNDEYKNLILITTNAHRLIHAITPNTIDKYMDIIKPDQQTLKVINKFRKKVGNDVITI